MGGGGGWVGELAFLGREDAGDARLAHLPTPPLHACSLPARSTVRRPPPTPPHLPPHLPPPHTRARARSPDVLPPAVMGELAKLQDKIEPFSTPEVRVRCLLLWVGGPRRQAGCGWRGAKRPPRRAPAVVRLGPHPRRPTPPRPARSQARAVVEKELGAPIDTLFSEFSAEPVAAASLAQVRTWRHAHMHALATRHPPVLAAPHCPSPHPPTPPSHPAHARRCTARGCGRRAKRWL